VNGDSGTLRVSLVETSDALPGLLPFQAWDVLGTADVVLLRDPETHPSALHLHLAGLDLERLEPAPLDRSDLDLTRPGAPQDRRYAKALVQRAATSGSCVYLLGPDDRGLAPALAGMAAEHDVEIELVLLAQQPPGTEVLRLAQVMRQLRDPETGCPWDLEQDHGTLVRYLVEESYELIDAIERRDDVDLVEELGDVLLQVVFHAQIAQDRRAFGLDDVARGIADKLVRRHPHVFADGDAATAEEVQSNWDRLKDDEKGRDGPFEGVPAAGPGLHLLETLQRKASRLGFEWRDAEEPADRVRLELAEVAAASDPDERETELGDLIGAVVGLARQLDVDPEAAARRAATSFRDRFDRVLGLAAARELDPAELDGSAWLALWEEAKAEATDAATAAGGAARTAESGGSVGSGGDASDREGDHGER
jgi:XTP/dITP diphosphohydrolase